MAETSINFEFKITKGDEFLEKGSFGIKADNYLCAHLKCSLDDLDDVLSKTSEEDILEIAEWAYHSCDHMNNILRESSGEMKVEIAENEAKKLAETSSEDYDELYEDILDQLVCRVTSVEILIDGKIYKGK
jgi:hypothetical protein